MKDNTQAATETQSLCGICNKVFSKEHMCDIGMKIGELHFIKVGKGRSIINPRM